MKFTLIVQMQTRALALSGRSRREEAPSSKAEIDQSFLTSAATTLKVRIGIHVGEVVIEEHERGSKPKDIYGTQIDLCARVMGLAEGGQILLTRAVFDSARQVSPDSEPVLGWRPALGRVVPNTKWVLEKTLGEGENGGSAAMNPTREELMFGLALTRPAVEHVVFPMPHRRRSALDKQGRADKIYGVMSAILEIPEVRERVSPLSVEEYHRLDEYNERGRRTELIRGIVIEKMSKSPLHRIIASLLYRRFLAQVPKGFSVWKEEPLTFLDSEPEPDLSVTRGDEHDYLESHPTSAELVVEVAVSSPALDREKAKLCAEAGIKEYWIVLGTERPVEVYRCPDRGQYQEKRVYGPDDELECAAVAGVCLRVGELFG